MLVDSHCHLDFDDLVADLPGVFSRMAGNDVAAAVCIGVNLEDWPKVRALAESDARLFATVGVHPEYSEAEEATVAKLCELAAHPKVIAIGETGLDYYWHKDAPEWQRERFRTHIRAARRCGKPLIIHTRDSAADTLRLMREEGADQPGGVMHCFTESREVAEQALDLGFYISFSGIVSFKNAESLREVARYVPLDRLLVETDAPYLAPVPFRGKTNQPAYVRHVAEAVANARGVNLPTIAEATTNNFFSLFKDARPS